MRDFIDVPGGAVGRVAITTFSLADPPVFHCIRRSATDSTIRGFLEVLEGLDP